MKRRGATALEFAILMPVVMVLFCGIFESGWAFYQHDVLVRAVRAGCRAGAIADAADRTLVAEDAVLRSLQDAGFACEGSGCTVDVHTLADTSTTGMGHDAMLACSVRKPVSPLTAAIPGLDGLHIKAATRLRVEWSPR